MLSLIISLIVRRLKIFTKIFKIEKKIHCFFMQSKFNRKRALRYY